MLTVCILVNGHPIMARSATNTAEVVDGYGNILYLCDTGDKIHHNPEDGAVALAIEMLKTIKEKP
jgi:hypothetical protein